MSLRRIRTARAVRSPKGGAARADSGAPAGRWARWGPSSRTLDLTDAQKDQLKGIMDSHRDELTGLGDRAMKAAPGLCRPLLWPTRWMKG
jgi:Spy/CpxP family protein refolding chaperone